MHIALSSLLCHIRYTGAYARLEEEIQSTKDAMRVRHLSHAQELIALAARGVQRPAIEYALECVAALRVAMAELQQVD